MGSDSFHPLVARLLDQGFIVSFEAGRRGISIPSLEDAAVLCTLTGEQPPIDIVGGGDDTVASLLDASDRLRAKLKVGHREEGEL